MVDAYAQELRRLYQKADPESLCGSEDAEKVGKTLLASQFVDGLRPEIKKSITGSDQSGDIEPLLVKARFEEAKLANLKSAECASHSSTSRTVHSSRDSPPHSHGPAKSSTNSHNRQRPPLSSFKPRNS